MVTTFAIKTLHHYIINDIMIPREYKPQFGYTAAKSKIALGGIGAAGRSVPQGFPRSNRFN
jgi:hypothetical protein